eukprot:2361362-Pyramimonas_sp.AAC.1
MIRWKKVFRHRRNSSCPCGRVVYYGRPHAGQLEPSLRVLWGLEAGISRQGPNRPPNPPGGPRQNPQIAL